MSQDRRDQSKFGRSAAEPGSMRGPARPVAREPVAREPVAPEPVAPGLGGRPAAADPPASPASVAPTAQAAAVNPATTTPVAVPLRPFQPQAGPIPVDSSADDNAEDDTDDDADDEPLTLIERLRRVPPAPILLTIGSIASVLFLLLAVTSHTTPVAVLLSAAVVTGLIFGVDAIIASVVTWRLSQSGEVGRAFLAAMVGGVASLVSLGALAGTLVLILVLNS